MAILLCHWSLFHIDIESLACNINDNSFTFCLRIMVRIEINYFKKIIKEIKMNKRLFEQINLKNINKNI